MEDNPLYQQIQDAQRRLDTLRRRVKALPGEQSALTAEAVEEVSIALEELGVAAEELAQQNDELISAHETIELERRRYRELFEFAPDGYLVTDPEGAIQEANRAAVAMLNKSEDFLLGKPLVIFVAQEDRRDFHHQLNRLREGRQDRVGDWEISLQPRRGASFPTAITISTIRDRYSRLIGLRWLLRDITRRKQAEEALRTSENKLRGILSSMVDLVFVFDEETRFTFYNAPPKELFLPPDNFMEKKHAAVMPAHCTELFEAAIDKNRRGEAANYEYWLEIGDEVKWFSTKLSPIFSEGDYQGSVAVVRDITERKRADEILKRRNQELALLNEVSQKLAITLNVDQVLIDGLTEVRRLLEATACSAWLIDPEANHLVCQHSIGPQSDVVQGWCLDIGEGIAGQVTQIGESELVTDTRDNEHHFKGVDEQIGLEMRSILTVPLRVRNDVIGVIQVTDTQPHYFQEEDLTLLEPLAASIAIAIDNARLIEALRQQTAELEAHNRELDAFGHTVAHDLKNPLTLIMGYADVLNKGLTGEMPREELEKHFQAVIKQGQKMKNIIDELLLLSSVRKLKLTEMEPLDMDNITDEAVARLELMIEEHQAQITMPKTWPEAMGYAPWVEEVWVNYISNAIKYGGQPPRVELGADLGVDGSARFWVRDNGPGLPAEEQDRLFTPFTQLNQADISKGHGLGLSIVQRIVDKLGGKTDVKSNVGEGSVFSFTLPSAHNTTVD